MFSVRAGFEARNDIQILFRSLGRAPIYLYGSAYYYRSSISLSVLQTARRLGQAVSSEKYSYDNTEIKSYIRIPDHGFGRQSKSL